MVMNLICLQNDDEFNMSAKSSIKEKNVKKGNKLIYMQTRAAALDRPLHLRLDHKPP